MASRSDNIVLIALLVMAITTAGAVATCFYLYRWRRLLSADKRFSVPEELIASLKYLGKEIRISSSRLGQAMRDNETGLQNVAEKSTKTDKRISEILETVILLQRALDERDAEIRRLRQGYDAEVFRRFITRFVRVKQLIDDCHSLGQYTPEDCISVGRLLDDAFEECGVEQFAPRVGADYRNAEGVADNPRVVHTCDPSQSFSIAEIVQPGYRFRQGEQGTIVVPARVSIFMAQQQAG